MRDSIKTIQYGKTFVVPNIYTVIGEPVPLARPRFSSRSNKTKVWDSQEQVKTGAGLQIRSQHKGEPYKVPLHMDVCFYFEASERHPHGSFHHIKPDLDNLVKFVLDVCNGIVFKDDSLVASFFAVKKYDNFARTEFSFMEITWTDLPRKP